MDGPELGGVARLSGVSFVRIPELGARVDSFAVAERMERPTGRVLT